MSASDRLRDELLSRILKDLQELALEVSKLMDYFEDTASLASGTNISVPAPAVTSTAAAQSSSSTSSGVVTATAKFKRSIQRGKGRLKTTYKEDRILELKAKIKEYIEIIDSLCNAHSLYVRS